MAVLLIQYARRCVREWVDYFEDLGCYCFVLFHGMITVLYRPVPKTHLAQ